MEQPAEATLEHAGTDLRARRRRELRQHVAAVAIRLFEAHGYEAVTTDEIAVAAGISKRTLFRHFSSKEEIVLGRTRELLGAFNELDVSGMRPAEVLQSIGDVYAVMIQRMAADPAALEEQKLIACNDGLRQAAQTLHRELTENLRHQLAQSSDLESSLRSRVIIEISTGVLHASLDEWANKSPDSNTLYDIYSHARYQVHDLLSER